VLLSGDRRAVFFIGQPHNIAAVKATYDWLVETLERIADNEALSKKGTEGYTRSSDLRRFRNSFLQGAVLGVQKAMWDERSAREANVRALVVTTDEAIGDWISNKYEHLREDACRRRRCGHMESKHEELPNGERGRCLHNPQPALGKIAACKCKEYTTSYDEEKLAYDPNSRRRDHDAYEHGYEAGRSVPLNRQEKLG
jgi:hypothetical protein